MSRTAKSLGRPKARLLRMISVRSATSINAVPKSFDIERRLPKHKVEVQRGDGGALESGGRVADEYDFESMFLKRFCDVG